MRSEMIIFIAFGYLNFVYFKSIHCFKPGRGEWGGPVTATGSGDCGFSNLQYSVNYPTVGDIIFCLQTFCFCVCIALSECVCYLRAFTRLQTNQVPLFVTAGCGVKCTIFILALQKCQLIRPQGELVINLLIYVSVEAEAWSVTVAPPFPVPQSRFPFNDSTSAVLPTFTNLIQFSSTKRKQLPGMLSKQFIQV